MSGGSSSSGQSFIAISISPDPGITLQLHSLHATEELGRPFQYDLSLASDTATPNLASWLGASCTLTMTLPDKSSRYFNGIIGRAVYDGLVGGAYHYRIEMRPWIWLLSRVQDCFIFQNQTVFAIINAIFTNNNFTNTSDKRQNSAGSETLKFCVQYQ